MVSFRIFEIRKMKIVSVSLFFVGIIVIVIAEGKVCQMMENFTLIKIKFAKKKLNVQHDQQVDQ